MAERTKTYVVDHLDLELGPWSALEYQAIAAETSKIGSNFRLTSVHDQLTLPRELLNTAGFTVDNRSVEEVYGPQKNRVCLLDPAAGLELSPDDAKQFDVFLFGGILGKQDQSATEVCT